MKRYFAKEFNSITRAETKKDPLEITRRKESVPVQYEVVTQLQRDISIEPHIIWFTVHVLAAMLLGALLNSTVFNDTATSAHARIYLAIGLLFLFIPVKVFHSCYEVGRIIAFEDWWVNESARLT